MKKTGLIIVFSILICSAGYSEINGRFHKNNKLTTLGLGLGLTYGGLGGKLTHNLSENFGMIAGLGYNFVGLGYNMGMQFYIPSKTKAQGYVSAMFGTNAAIAIEDTYLGEVSKSYSGFSFGFGINLKSRKSRGNFWEFGLIVPIPSQAYKDERDKLNSSPGIDFKDPSPVLINIGYNFKIGG